MNYYVLALDAFLVFLLNIPFGYWRANTRKFSVPWFLAIHLPIPLVVLIRIQSHLGFAWYTYPIMVGAFFLGQRVGYHIRKRKAAKKKDSITE